MKTTMVPAQVTTVEDKIAGSLNLTQLILLCTPIFISGAVYALFPPLLKFSFIKVLIIILTTVVLATLSIRFKGKLLINWIVVIGRYQLRPRYYIYNKNDLYLRKTRKLAAKIRAEKRPEPVKKLLPTAPNLPIPKIITLQALINDPRSNFRFSMGKKGGLDVHITEVK
jgi:hypothetical protein